MKAVELLKKILLGAFACAAVSVLLVFPGAETAKADGPHVHCVCGATEVIAAAGHTEENVTWTAWTSTTSLPSTAGAYYLTADVTLSATSVIPSDTDLKLCLNGHTVNQSSTRVYSSYNGSAHNNGITLSITDCQEKAGTVQNTRTTNNNAGGLFWFTGTGNTLNLYNGTFTVKKTSYSSTVNGALISIGGSDTLNIYGGTVKGGTTTGNGTCVYFNSSAAFNLYGGTIRDGYATKNGGNVYLYKGTTTMYGGLLTGGTTEDSGGNLTVQGSAVFYMKGGVIENGLAKKTNANYSSSNIFLHGNSMTAYFEGGTVKGRMAVMGIKKLGFAGTPVIRDGSYGFTVSNTDSAVTAEYIVIGTPDKERMEEGAELYVQTFDRSGNANFKANGVEAPSLLAKNAAAGDEAYFSTNTATYTKPAYRDGMLIMQKITSHCICGGALVGRKNADGTDHVCTNVSWTPYGDSTTTSMPLKSGNYYVAENFETTVINTAEEGAVIHIDLNGHTITSTGARVYSTYDSTLKKHRAAQEWSFCDSSLGSGAVKLSRTTSDQGAIVWGAATTSSKLAIYGGTFYSSNNSYVTDISKNGALFAFTSPKSEFILYDGVIEKGHTIGHGGNIYFSSSGGTFYMLDGEVKNGKADSYANEGSYSGGCGGNIAVLNGNVKITGGTISGGVAKSGLKPDLTEFNGMGGNLFISSSGTVEISNLTLLNGAAKYGGNAYISGTKAKTVKDSLFVNGASEDETFIYYKDGSMDKQYYTAVGHGANLYVTSGNVTLKNCGLFGGSEDENVFELGACKLLISDGEYTGRLNLETGAVISGGFFENAPGKTLLSDGYSAKNAENESSLTEGYSLHYQVIKGYEVLTTSVIDGSEEPVSGTFGGGVYENGMLPTVGAEPVSGYRLSGWYKKVGDEEPVLIAGATGYTYEETAPLTAVTTYIAVFTPDSSKILLTVTAPGFKLSVNDGAFSDEMTSYSGVHDKGTKVKLQFTGDEDIFLAWTNASGKVLSRDAESVILTLCATTEVKGVTGQGENSTLIAFLNDKAQVIKSVINAQLAASDVPSPSLRIGLRFAGYSIIGQEGLISRTELVSSVNGLLASEKEVQILPVYEENTEEVNIFLQNGIAAVLDTENPAFLGFAKSGAPVKATAPATGIYTVNAASSLATGETFAAALQKIGDGWQILSRTETFTVRALDGETVYLVYAKGAVKEEKPAISLTVGTANPQDGGKYTYSFTASRTVPDSYKVLDQGLVFTNSTLLGNAGAAAADGAVKLDSQKAVAYKSNGVLNNDITTLNVKNIPDPDMMFYVRGYMILENAEGEQEYYETGLLYGSFNTAFKLFENGTAFAKTASIEESELEIGAKDTTVYLHILTDDEGTAPHDVTVTSDNPAIVASWSSADPFRISVYGSTLGAEGNVSAVVDGIVLPSVPVKVIAHTHVLGTHSDIVNGTGEAVNFTPWTDSKNVPTKPGYYYLETDVETKNTYYPAQNSNVVLCFNGHTVTYNGACRLYSSYDTTKDMRITLSFCDCREDCGGVVCDSDVTMNQGAAVWVTKAGSTFNLYGGTISGTDNFLSNSPRGGLVTAEGSSTFNMYGGTIKDGTSLQVGANVAITTDSVFNMYGGEILNGSVHSHDTAQTYGGNLYICDRATVHIYKDAVIRGGEARENIYSAIATTGVHQGHGGNIAIVGGTVTIEGALITEGYCAVSAGNIYFTGANSKLTIDGARITDGYGYNGGGMQISSGTVEIKGETVITGNKFSGSNQESRGGGVFFSSGTLKISGKPYIYDNVGKGNGNQENLYIASKRTVDFGTLREGTKIGVSVTNSTSTPYVHSTRDGFANVPADYSDYFVPDDRTSFMVEYAMKKLNLVPFTSDFMMGFARVDVTPTMSVPLAGYGRTWARMSTNILSASRLKTTCIAITGDGGTILMFTTDCIRAAYVDEVRQAINKATGVPANNILLTATHTHSGPDVSFSNSNYPEASNAIKAYKEFYIPKMVEAAELALADQSYVAASYSGDVDTVYSSNGKTMTMNWVRHYTLQDRFGNYAGVKGDNFNQLYSKDYTGSVDSEGDLVKPAWTSNGTTLSGHTTAADPSMRILKFERSDDKPDIVLVNWRAHPTKTGGSSKTDISADYVAPFRDELEKQTGCVAAFFQGAAGNMNTTSSISGETYSSDYIVYGKYLASFAINALKTLPETECDGSIEVVREDYAGLRKNNTYYSEEEINAAQKISALFTAEGNSNTLYELCRLTGNMVHSAYDANSIISKSKVTSKTLSIPLYTFRIGNFAFAEAPYEMFDTNSKFIRENGLALGFDNVFVMGYSNGSNSYVPSQIGFTQGTDTLFGSYEGDQCNFRPIQYYVDASGKQYTEQNAEGTLTPVYVGEDLANHFVELLKSIKH